MFDNIASAWSINTISTRSSQWKRFLTFCVDHGLTPMPASPRTVARFLSELGLTCKYSTIVNYLLSITTMHKFYGYDTDFRDSYYLSMAVKGIKVKIGSEVHHMVALSPNQLIQMYAYVSLLDEFQVACWAAIIFSFRTLLRKSNFLPDNLDYNPHLISRKDIKFTDDGMVVSIATSKSDRSGGNPQRMVVYETAAQQPLCAVSWLRNHFKTTPQLELGVFVKSSSKGFCTTDVQRRVAVPAKTRRIYRNGPSRRRPPLPQTVGSYLSKYFRHIIARHKANWQLALQFGI